MFARIKYPMMAPAGESGGGGDRGDDFVPTDDDVDAAAAAAQKAADDAAKAAKGDEAPPADGKEPDAGLRVAAPADDDKDDDKDADKEGKGIPLARHKQILERERQNREELERKLAQYEKGQHIAATNDQIDKLEGQVTELEKSYTKLLTDGEHEKAAEAMSKIRKLEREISEAKTSVHVAAAEARAIEKVRFDTAAERLEEAYPVLNPESDEYDPDVVKEVLELQRGYALQNYTPTQALQKAVKYVLKPVTRTQEQATSVTPRVDKDAVAAERKVAATKKALDATGRQPPALKVGMDSDRAGGGLSAKDVMKMSQDEFSKLTDEQLARMRGDEL